MIVGFMVARMGWGFGWDALHDLVDRSVDEAEVQAIRQTLMDTPGVSNVHDVRTRKMGDMIIVDAHAVSQAGRSRNLRIGLLESGFNLVASLPADAFLTERLAQLQPDMIIVDAHIEVDALITVEAGHDIAVEARQRVLQRHRVLNLMTHVDPWHRPDLDHPVLETAPSGPTC